MSAGLFSAAGMTAREVDQLTHVLVDGKQQSQGWRRNGNKVHGIRRSAAWDRIRRTCGVDSACRGSGQGLKRLHQHPAQPRALQQRPGVQ